ncbi:Gfo/Idh/MocA family oxidoreductase [Lascolabacillus sp.]|jgi:predicted dehydrogenase|uniref:Gfo/Idh/MocA family oxidoreductase n=1 Tax=Lascolabacillus sp. TaxID=1924068 RepID=UPI0025900FCA|nr:Gfo/Idh/MocA family oxidoreductase [Lascolabacillus sp.]MCK9500275.1 Gfo/Idh/MocA family oxidoreductase [Lascolabacillus sp.]MDD2607442.1 Gfo/Idh/MocA family oxidoreductase [Lascolabacillus sp.]MDI9626467.1 Gfo/Idh/MocA family oxidoreductase [Bacteroidota bacterium]
MTTRRDFIKSAALASAGLAIGSVSNKMNAASYSRIVGANKKINLAHIGIGNRGWEIIEQFDNTGLANVVALCDVDLGAEQTKKALAKFPHARRFKDFREMFDKMGNEIEAVAIATPDFAHFPAVMMSMTYGKHVYVEKPLSRTFYESELLIKAAKKYPKVVTQMGNQGHSEANYFQFKAWTEAGIIKDVTAITAHMNNARRWHGWDTNIKHFPAAEPIPETLDWDTWLMSRDYHAYNKDFHNGQWRCWYDFGMGALGDWGAHIIDTAHRFLDLGLPEEITPLKLTGHNDFFFPMSSTIEFKFPKRGDMPPVVITWYDGVDNIPPVPEGYGKMELDPNIPAVAGGKIQPARLNPGKEIYSKELTFKGGSHGSILTIIPDEKAKELEKSLPEVPESTSNHFANFLLACQGKEQTRSPFEISGPLSQVFCLGVAAQRLNRKIVFDRDTKRVTNDAFADAFLIGEPPRKGWEDFYKI